MKVLSAILAPFVAITIITIWSSCPQLVLSQTCTLNRLAPPVQMPQPPASNIFAFRVPSCWSPDDGADNGLQSFPARLEQLEAIANFTGDVARLGALANLTAQFRDIVSAVGPGQPLGDSTWQTLCNSSVLKSSDLIRESFLHPALDDIFFNSELNPQTTNIYTAEEMLDRMPQVPNPDRITRFGPNNICRFHRRADFPQCPPRSRCEGLTNVTTMPQFVVDIMRGFCGILSNDVTLNNDPGVTTLFWWGDFLRACRDPNFYEAIRCMPYNRSFRHQIQNFTASLSVNSDRFSSHLERILGSFLDQATELVKELQDRFSFNLLLEGADCTGSFDYREAWGRILDYLARPVDGSIPFGELAFFERKEFRLTRERDVINMLRNSCNFTLGLTCNTSTCICDCRFGPGNCKEPFRRKNSADVQHSSNYWTFVSLIIFLLSMWYKSNPNSNIDAN